MTQMGWSVGESGSPLRVIGATFCVSVDKSPHPLFDLYWREDQWELRWTSGKSMYELLTTKGAFPPDAKARLVGGRSTDPDYPAHTFSEMIRGLKGFVKNFGVPDAELCEIVLPECRVSVARGYFENASIYFRSDKDPRVATDDILALVVSTEPLRASQEWFGEALLVAMQTFPIIVDALAQGQTWRQAVNLANNGATKGLVLSPLTPPIG